MNFLDSFLSSIDSEVRKIFNENCDENPLIKFTQHALEELDFDEIDPEEVISLMKSGHGELISQHWEVPFRGLKLIYYIETTNHPPIHIILILSQRYIIVKTGYNVDYTKFESDGKTRKRKR